MFSWFENLVDPFREVANEQPPATLGAFYWHYVRQAWKVFAAIMVVGLFGALVELSLFAFLGQLVDLMKVAENPPAFFSSHGSTLIFMALIALVARPVLFGLHTVIVNQAVTANVGSLVRWQTYRYVLRQSLGFFQNDFSGRISNKIIMSGPSLAESVLQSVDAIWFVLIYTVGALALFFSNDPRLIIPLLIWLVVYVAILVILVPRIKRQAVVMSEARSVLMGRVVDSYTNILTVKLFSHTAREDSHVKDALLDQTQKLQLQLRSLSVMEIALTLINGVLIVTTCGLALWLWSEGDISIGAIALATGLVLRIIAMSGWIMWVVTGIFRNIGTVQECMDTISQPHEVADEPDSRELLLSKGAISFEHVKFHYGKAAGVIDDLTLKIAPGERLGVVGRSGAGKSTLVNLLLRFYDLEEGRITIDGQDISGVTQDSLRRQIGMVTQDTSLLHRTVRDNIRYGDPDASDAEVIAAAGKAQAVDFINSLEDRHGRSGYQALVGERGVKLSGGQRQRIAIARVLLKDAPILILDEATSALDSEVEADIQHQLYTLMEGKTVIAIAHRLSTIAAMDRLIVMDEGQIVEQGSHQELLEKNGIYALLWKHQSGGFLGKTVGAR